MVKYGTVLSAKEASTRNERHQEHTRVVSVYRVTNGVSLRKDSYAERIGLRGGGPGGGIVVLLLIYCCCFLYFAKLNSWESCHHCFYPRSTSIGSVPESWWFLVRFLSMTLSRVACLRMSHLLPRHVHVSSAVARIPSTSTRTSTTTVGANSLLSLLLVASNPVPVVPLLGCV
jgi:hypothetical protein